MYSRPFKGKYVKNVSLWRGKPNNAMWASDLELPPTKTGTACSTFFTGLYATPANG